MVDLGSLVLRTGSHTRAVGRVVGYDGQVWFEPALAVPLVGYPPGGEPAPRPSGRGVLAHGVDLEDLADRRSKDGGVEGWAALGGLWRADHLAVSEQNPARPVRRQHRSGWERPPCDPPPGGWPHGPTDADPDPGPPEDIPEAVAVTLFRPSTTQVVLVVATTEPALAEAVLRPLYGPAVCIVPSGWTAQSVDRVQADLRRHWADWTLYVSGRTSSHAGQAVVTAELVRVLPEMVDWAASIPEGLLEVDAWLTPRREPRGARPRPPSPWRCAGERTG